MLSLEEVSDEKLYQLVRQDDVLAFRALYDKYWKELYIKACRRVEEEEAKDIIQEIMITFWKRRKDIVILTDEDVPRYLNAALKYKIISYFTRSSSKIKKMSYFETPADLSYIPAIVELKELKQSVETEVNKLPARMRQIFRMSREDNYSTSDIADHLHISEQTVKNQLTEALKRLRCSLQSKTLSEFIILFVFAYYL